MGGLLIMAAMFVPFLIFSERTLEALTAFFVTLACAAIGFVDDWTKLTRRRSLGLPGRWKLVFLGLITAFVAIVVSQLDYQTDVYLPLIGVDVELSYGWYVLLFLMIAGAANGVNLTDGPRRPRGRDRGDLRLHVHGHERRRLDRLGRSPGGDPEDLDLAILGASLIGASIGFLWFNAYLAQAFMGDTGSMGLGGALAAFAILSKTEVLLLLIGGIFLIEALSVILQVISFKWTGKRIFLMAPLPTTSR